MNLTQVLTMLQDVIAKMNREQFLSIMGLIYDIVVKDKEVD